MLRITSQWQGSDPGQTWKVDTTSFLGDNHMDNDGMVIEIEQIQTLMGTLQQKLSRLQDALSRRNGITR